MTVNRRAFLAGLGAAVAAVAAATRLGESRLPVLITDAMEGDFCTSNFCYETNGMYVSYDPARDYGNGVLTRWRRNGQDLELVDIEYGAGNKLSAVPFVRRLS